MKKKIIIFLFIIFNLSTINIYCQFTTIGTDFWLSFLKNKKHPTCIVYITSESGSSGVISMPGTGWLQTFTVPINGSISITIPDIYNPSDTLPNTILNKGIHIVSGNPISVYAANQAPASSDATLIIPTDALGNEYRVMCYSPLSDSPTEFLILGVEDNTQIQIIPTAAVYGGVGANVPFNITLNQGDVYLVRSYGDLTGTLIKSINTNDCKTFAVFAGHECAYVPVTCQYCDHLYEQMIPTHAWGRNYITTPLLTRNGDQFRILAKDNGTVVHINGGAPINLNAGQFHETYLTQASYITSNNPISVAQYSRGSKCDNTISDPFMVILSPTEQFMNHIVFQAFNTSVINQFYVNLITKTSFTNLVTLDGTTLSGWNTVPSNTQFSYNRLYLSQGTHLVHSDTGVTALVYGYGSDDSYGYLGGANLKPLNLNQFIIIGDDTISLENFNDTLECDEMTVDFFIDDTTNFTNIHWSFGDGTTAQGASVTHTFPGEGTFTLILYFERAGTCMLDSIVTQIITNTTIEVDATASANTICAGESVVISATGGDTYQWSNGYSSQSITVTPNTTTTYTVTGTDVNGCFDIATVNIYVNPLPQININANPSEICVGQSTTLTASGGNTYLWSTNEADSSIVVSPLNSTTYYVTVTDTNLCNNSSSFLLNVHPLPNINISAQPDTNICIGMSAILTASGGVNYQWSNGQNNNQITIQPTNSTTYYVTVTDNHGCIDSSFLNIYVNPYPHVDFYADILNGCQPLKVNFINTSDNGSYHWLFGDGGTTNINNPTHIYNQDGIFDVTLIVKNEYNCSDTLTKNDYIMVYPQPVANFRPIPNIVTENNGAVTINDESIDAENWYYDFGDTSTTTDIFFINEPSYTYTIAGNYIITQIVSNNYNCSDTATNLVIVKSDFMLYVPNSFTPSTKNDLNDYFHIFSYGLTPEKFYIKIFNRWGQMVFYSSDPGFKWDGKCDNDLCPQGVYTYVIHYKTPDNNEHNKYGYIILLH